MRRRSRPAADPEVIAALAALDRYRGMLEALRAAGDQHAPWRLHVLWWARHDIEQYGMDVVSRAAAARVRAGDPGTDRAAAAVAAGDVPGSCHARVVLHVVVRLAVVFPHGRCAGE